jgi:hypothetical protein
MHVRERHVKDTIEKEILALHLGGSAARVSVVMIVYIRSRFFTILDLQAWLLLLSLDSLLHLLSEPLSWSICNYF